MNRTSFHLIKWVATLILPFVVLMMSACSPTSSSALISAASPSPTKPITIVRPTLAPTESPTATSPLPTVAVTETIEPTKMFTPTATRRAVNSSSRSTATATLALPSGVFISAIKITPVLTKSGQVPQFIVTFLNTTGKSQSYRWFVKIYQPDQPQSFGETARLDSDIAPKASDIKAFSDWKTTAVLDCLFLIARVFWVDGDGQVHEFLKPNGNSPATGFNVCP